MSIKKTLGGDRLGSGKKMQVELHNYERSTHDLGYLWRSTMSAGTLVPFMSKVVLPGDTFDIHLECDIKTHPTIGPLFGSYKVQLDTFLAPLRLYNAFLHNNELGIGMKMSRVKLPTLDMRALKTPDVVADRDNQQINPSCILSYLGLRGVGLTDETDGVIRSFQMTPLLAYWEIYKNYYANKMEEIGAFIHTPSSAVNKTIDSVKQDPGTLSILVYPGGTVRTFNTAKPTMTINYTGTPPDAGDIIIGLDASEVTFDEFTGLSWSDSGTQLVGDFDIATFGDNLQVRYWRYRDASDPNQGKPRVAIFTLSQIDQMRRDILAWQDDTTPFDITGNNLEPYRYLNENPNDIPNVLSSQEGLGLKTYQSDLFNNWLNTEWIDGTNGISEVTSIDTSGGSFTIDTLNLSKKVYDMLNRIAVSGGSYDDWLDAVYVHPRYTRAESPMYMGGLIRELVFQEVVSNSASEDQPLGTLSGKGVMGHKKKGGHIVVKVDEPAYLMGIISLTPRIDNSQGNSWDITNLRTLDDLHKPQLDEIGFQELITEQMAWWDTKWDGTKWVQKSAGKQPAWINYMTSVNEVRGNFAIATNEMFMTLNRRYEYDPMTGIKDLTTYIDPSKFNFIFAQTSLDAQNFWAQIAVDITARRKMSAKVMPNL